MNKIENNNKNYRNEQIAGIAHAINNLRNIMEENLIEEGKKRTEYLNENEVYYEIQASGFYHYFYEGWKTIWAEVTIEEALKQLLFFKELYKYTMTYYDYRLVKINKKDNDLENSQKSNNEKELTYRCKFVGIVSIDIDESGRFAYLLPEDFTMFLSLDIPIDYQTLQQAKNCNCILKYETDMNNKIVLNLYDDSENVVATIDWWNKEKYNYIQSYNIEEKDGMIKFKNFCYKRWDEIFYIPENGNFSQTVSYICIPFGCTNSQNEELTE